MNCTLKNFKAWKQGVESEVEKGIQFKNNTLQMKVLGVLECVRGRASTFLNKLRIKEIMKKLFAAGIAALLLSNCAAMFNGSTRQVSIRSNEDDAEIYVNEAYIGKNSGVTTLRKKENYTISVKKEGCTASSIPVDKAFDATTLLGIFIDLGIISIFVVDGLATGAWQDFPQTSYVVDPVCPKEASNN